MLQVFPVVIAAPTQRCDAVRLSLLRRANTARLLALLSLAPLLVGHGAFQDVVLCVGSDGHVALESSVSDRSCGPLFQREHQNAPVIKELRSVADHCGPCLDVGVPDGAPSIKSSGPSRILGLQPHLPSSPVSSPNASSGPPPGISSLRSPSFGSTSLGSLRSVVLLI